MNVYLIHTLCRRVLHDKGFRKLILENPEAAVSSMPFSDEERKALLTGDVARLHREGALAFLLLILSRFEVFGLELPIFNRRMRTGSSDSHCPNRAAAISRPSPLSPDRDRRNHQASGDEGPVACT
jgi:hypothetical protein